MPKGESNNGNRNRAASHLPVLVDPRLVKALDHVLGEHILLATVAGGVRAHTMVKGLGGRGRQNNYPAKSLCEDCDGDYEGTRTPPPRGADGPAYHANAKTP